MKIDRDKLHLLHIRDAIEKIELYSKDVALTDFAKSGLVFDAIMMQIIVVGEAVNGLSEEFKERHHDMPWHQAVGLRNQTAHGYLDIKANIVWKTLKEDLPVLKDKVQKILG
ncbi:MAG: putative cytosolic protein [Berkelbacteria bacterium GW2011_GWA2_46_7]|uniref:Putative cytosolic protein n=1 Tax=Berkelbacteria bacterium GW2011_GWA2_46_7 TaxID=1618335 RepID=A0A0G1SQV6_9BACT|nr:MAG: putative cytosolic protein [Berkelbacteria bacterium GW2011_GWA2_46_7]